MIQSTDYTGDTLTLVDEDTGEPVTRGEVRETFRGDRMVITGGRAPHKPGSTGKIWVREDGGDAVYTREYFPSVCGLEWRHHTGPGRS